MRMIRREVRTVWSSVDFSAVEMSTLAQVCLWTVKKSSLAEAINDDKDVHSMFAAKLCGLTYEEFIRRKKEDKFKDLRQAAKAANFGFPGMMGATKFVVAQRRAGNKVCQWFGHECGKEKVRMWRGQDLAGPLCKQCLIEAQTLKEGFSKQWPEMKAYWKWVTNQLDWNNGKLTQFISNRVRGGLHAPAAANTLFQGLAADGAKAAVIQMTKEMYLVKESALFGSRLVNFSHDETIIEIPEKRANEAALRQAEVMVAEMKKYVPDVMIKAEPALMRRWYKQAEPVYKEGRLCIWEPS